MEVDGAGWRWVHGLAIPIFINLFCFSNSKGENVTDSQQGNIKISAVLDYLKQSVSFCKMTSQKLHFLARISHYMDLTKRRNLMKAVSTSQFSNCPLISMFHTLIVIVIISFGRLPLFRHIFNRCKVLCNFNIKYS